MNEEPTRVQSRPNIANQGKLSFRKRYENAGYWALLGIVLLFALWFLVNSASDRGSAEDVEATVIATLFVPETATAEAEATLESVGQ
ncbi:MAG: hypothetical protein HOF01_02245 [Chloroflexi bacterium]|jgi:ammonia channel protein AmtB|nr:hypothetical protein [Chloroflexota bacterium]